MAQIFAVIFAFFPAVFPIAPAAHAQASELVSVIEMKGTINPATLDYLKHGLKTAKQDGAKALIVELDTPGGMVASVKEMAQAIDSSDIPVIVHVVPTGAAATSAGALLTLSAHYSFMAQGTHIGAAHPVEAGGKEIQGVIGEKATNDTAAFARGLAEKRNRNVAVAESMVRQSKSFSAQEALKEKLIDGLTANTEEILAFLQTQKKLTAASQARVIRIPMPLSQRVLHFLADPNIASMLLSLAIACIYIELSAPGVSLPGIVGVISLILSFMSFQMLPIRTGGLLLLILGVLFFIAEAFVTSHGLLAAGGAVAFVLGLIWVVDPAQSDLVVSPQVWVPMGLILLAVAVGFAWVATRGRKLAKETRDKIGGGDDFGITGYAATVESLSDAGAASGKKGRVQVRGESWEFESSTDVTVGQAVEITAKRDFLLVVRPK